MLTLAFVGTSCSSTKKTPSITEKSTEQVNTAQDEPNASTTDNSSSSMTQHTIATQVNGSTGAMSNIGVQNRSNSLKSEYATMFSKLEMSEEQMSTFTSAMRRFKDKQANTASGEMLGSIESERTRQLKDILSSSQFAKYEQWLAENN